jgi:hypothetical protein
LICFDLILIARVERAERAVRQRQRIALSDEDEEEDDADAEEEEDDAKIIHTHAAQLAAQKSKEDVQ